MQRAALPDPASCIADRSYAGEPRSRAEAVRPERACPQEQKRGGAGDDDAHRHEGDIPDHRAPTLTKREAAAYLRVSTRQLDRLTIPRSRVGLRKLVFLRDDLDRYLAANRFTPFDPCTVLPKTRLSLSVRRSSESDRAWLALKPQPSRRPAVAPGARIGKRARG